MPAVLSVNATRKFIRHRGGSVDDSFADSKLPDPPKR
jgi:hypothetical protein